MYGTFFEAKKFNKPLNWDTSSVTTLQNTFFGFHKNSEGEVDSCSCPSSGDYPLFNQPLTWDTAKATTMYRTFFRANGFNSELVWDTSQVTNLQETFWEAASFNKPLNWDTSKAKTMELSLIHI